ncbi:MAG: xanthine dehydrogenase family protein molybdopterin-binding subunit [Chloroflexi bacterium]|nr:xanthine dehydrogenase family protein molybdopterin-binding subunit [Chloroflexota bacterium]
MTTETTKGKYNVIGTRPIRHDGYDKVTGRAIYGADVKLPGLLQGAVLRSPHAHANLKSIDTSAAKALPGVHAVVTHHDFPAAEANLVDLGEGAVNFKHASNNVMAEDKVLYKGHPVAAVAAVDKNTALEAAALIKVVYEVLTPVTDVMEALKPGAPILHADLEGQNLGEKIDGQTNQANHIRHEFGDIDAGFAEADLVVEREFTTSMVHQGYIEPHNATATWDEENRVTIWTSTQGSFPTRRQVAGVLRMPDSQVKVIPLEIGGGFGGKIPSYLEPVAAILSRESGRPVKLLMERSSVFEATGPTPGSWMTAKVGVKKDGTITAAHTDIRFEAGAYPGSPVGAAMMCVFSCYDIPNTRIDGYDVVVNRPKTAAYRAPGTTQAAFAMETVIDEIIEELGMDPIEFRIKNASKEGTRRADGPIHPIIGNIETLEAAKASDHWNTPLEKNGPDGILRGRGVASGYWFNIGLKAAVTISVNEDGTVALTEGSTDIGGSRASISMMAAEVLGIPVEDVRPHVADTEGIGYTDVTGGSRTTYATGYASHDAAQDVVSQLRERAAKLWDVDTDEVEFSNGNYQSKSDPELKLSHKELSSKLGSTGGPVVGSASVDPEGAGGAFSTQIADVEIDPETGKTDVVRYTIVQDVGTAIHPAYVEGQMQGAVVQGIGWALNEEYFLNDDGAMVNSSFLDYRMPTTYDLPPIETVIVEVPNPGHPFGVRGVGEVPIVPPVATIANAIHDALGIRLRESPMNAGRIRKALEEKG